MSHRIDTRAQPANRGPASSARRASQVRLHKPPHPNNDVPDEFEPGPLPVEPDEGPVPPSLPDDPEHEHSVGSASNPSWSARRTVRPVAVALCR